MRRWLSLLGRRKRSTAPDHSQHLLHVIEELHGHRRSVREKKPVDHDGQPLPWYTYPAIAYLEGLDLSAKSIFEFGAGHSSWFFAKRAKEVFSVENNATWQAQIGGASFPNLEVLLREKEEDYVAALGRTERTWDVIAIDGVWRRRCARAALAHLAPTGLMILDNSDWYPHTAADLRAADLLQIDFTGLGPVNYYTWTTSLFLRRQVDLKPRGPVQPTAGLGSMPQVVDGTAC